MQWDKAIPDCDQVRWNCDTLHQQRTYNELNSCCFEVTNLRKRVAFIHCLFFFSLFTFSCVVTLLVQYRNSCALHRDLVAMCSGTLQQNEICSIFNLPPQPAVLGMQHVRKTESGGCKKCIHTGNWNCSVIHSCSAENPSCNLSFLILVWLGPDLLLAQTGAALLTSAGVYQFAPGGNLCQVFSATRIREQM